MLKSGWCISQPERYDEIFKRPISCSEGCLPLMARCNSNVIEPSMKIEFGIDVCTFKLVRNERYRILVLSHDVIQPSVVDTHP